MAKKKKKASRKKLKKQFIMHEALRFVSRIDDDPDDASCAEEKAAILSVKYEAARSDLEFHVEKLKEYGKKIEKKRRVCDSLLAQLVKVEAYLGSAYHNTLSADTEQVLSFGDITGDSLVLPGDDNAEHTHLIAVTNNNIFETGEGQNDNEDHDEC